MKYAIIENGSINNIALADKPLDSNWVELQDGFAIGDLYSNGTFSKAPTVNHIVEVPQTIQKWQAELILHDMGMLQSVKAVIDADPAMSIVYQGVTTFERTNGLITQVAMLQNISDDVIDKMFIAASRYTSEMATDQAQRQSIMQEVGLL